EACEPAVTVGSVGRPQAVLDEGEVPAQRLRHVRVGSREVDERRGERDDVATGPARIRRHPQGREAGLAQPLELLDRQHAFALAIDRTLADAGDRLVEAGHQVYRETG